MYPTITYRSLFSRLQHESVASGQRWCKLPGQHQQREVPWNDLTAHTNWLNLGEAVHISISGNGLAVDLVRPTSVILESADGGLYITTGLFQWLAIVQNFQFCQVLLITYHQISQFVQQTASGRSIRFAPFRA